MIKIQSKTILLSKLLLVLLSFATNSGMENECVVPLGSLYVPFPSAPENRLALNEDGSFSTKRMAYSANGSKFQIDAQNPIDIKKDFMAEIIKNEQNKNFYIRATKQFYPTHKNLDNHPHVRIDMTNDQFNTLNTIMFHSQHKGVIVAIDNNYNHYAIERLIINSTTEKKPEIELEKLSSQQTSPAIEEKEKLNQEGKEIDKIMKRDETDEQEKIEIDDFSIKSTSKKNQPAPYWTTNKIALAAVAGMSLFAALLYFIHTHNSFVDFNVSELFKNIPFISAHS